MSRKRRNHSPEFKVGLPWRGLNIKQISAMIQHNVNLIAKHKKE